MVLPLSEWVLSLQSNLLGNFFTDTPGVYFHGYCQYRPHQWERADVQGMLHDSSSMKCLEQTNSYNRRWIDSKFSLGGWLERWTITGSCHNWVQSFFYGKWKCSEIRLWCSPVEYSKADLFKWAIVWFIHFVLEKILKKMLGYWGFPLFKFYNMQTENWVTLNSESIPVGALESLWCPPSQWRLGINTL